MFTEIQIISINRNRNASQKHFIGKIQNWAVPSQFVHADLSIYVNTQGQLKVASQPMDSGKVDNLDPQNVRRVGMFCDSTALTVLASG